MNRRKRKRRAAAGLPAVLCALLACCAAARGQQVQPPASAPAGQDNPTGGTARPIRVGLVVSSYTANGPHWLLKPHGYEHAEVSSALADPSIELHAIIEPGTQDEPELVHVLERAVRPKSVIVCTDLAAMRKLDVLFVHRVWNLTDQMLVSLTQCVREGSGMVNVAAAGSVTPGYTPQVLPLLGMSQAGFYMQQTMTSARVITVHPLLGSLEAGSSVVCAPQGAIGPVTGTPLLVMRQIDTPFRTALEEPRQDLGPMHPLLITRLGRGRIVVCNWRAPPQALDEATGGFYRHCIRWLAAAETGDGPATSTAQDRR